MSKKKEDKKTSLHHIIHHKILHMKQRARITDKEVYTLSKEFFSQLLELDYEFSHEELIEELTKTYIEKKNLDKTIAFIQKLGKMEFTSNEYSHEELYGMLDELHDILDHLVIEEKELGWFAKFKKKFGKKEAERILEEPKDKEYTTKLKQYIEDIKKEKDPKKLKLLYQNAIALYEMLSEGEKITYYNKLLTIYHSLSTLEEKVLKNHKKKETVNKKNKKPTKKNNKRLPKKTIKKTTKKKSKEKTTKTASAQKKRN